MSSKHPKSMKIKYSWIKNYLINASDEILNSTLNSLVGEQRWKCPLCSRTFIMTTGSLLKRKHFVKCPICLDDPTFKTRNLILSKIKDKLHLQPLCDESSMQFFSEVTWECLDCNYKFTKVLSKSMGVGCLRCKAGKVLWPGHNDLASDEIKMKYFDWNCDNNPDPTTVRRNCRTIIQWRKECGHNWKCSPNNFSSICPFCEGKYKKYGREFAKIRKDSLINQNPEALKEWDPENELNPQDVSYGSHKTVKWICLNCDYHYEMPVKQHNKIGSCPRCCKCPKVVWVGHTDFKSKCPKLVQEWSNENLESPENVLWKSGKNVWWECSFCKNKWETSPHNRSRFPEKLGCKQCNLHKQNKNEIAIFDLMKKYVDSDTRTEAYGMLGRQSLDVLSDKFNFAIEFNGMYWHSRAIKNRDDPLYHQRKILECKRTGINLTMVWSDDWEINKSLIQKRIKNFVCPIDEITFSSPTSLEKISLTLTEKLYCSFLFNKIEIKMNNNMKHVGSIIIGNDKDGNLTSVITSNYPLTTNALLQIETFLKDNHITSIIVPIDNLFMIPINVQNNKILPPILINPLNKNEMQWTIDSKMENPKSVWTSGSILINL